MDSVRDYTGSIEAYYEARPVARVAPPPERALDWLNLFVANIQTGFGPFIVVYLTTQNWTQTAIGMALSLGTITAMASQVPAGALVDVIRRKSWVAGASVLAFTLSAVLFAARPTPLFVYIAEMLHGFSSCTLAPAIAAMSLAIAGRAAFGLRLGRNARFASIGNGLGALLMGACGYYLSGRAVFILTAVLTLPALAMLVPLANLDAPGRIARLRPPPPAARVPIRDVLLDRRLLVFALSALLFTLANAALLPLASTLLTKRAGDSANLLIAAGIVLPQAIVALLSPWVGRLAQSHGRRLVLLLAFSMLPLRGLLFALTTDPTLLVLIQAFDGLAAAGFGVLVPLVISDIAAGTGHFNLSLGFVGVAIGIGATCSTTFAGWIADRFGDPAAFLSLAAAGLGAVLIIWGAMAETRPEETVEPL